MICVLERADLRPPMRPPLEHASSEGSAAAGGSSVRDAVVGRGLITHRPHRGRGIEDWL